MRPYSMKVTKNLAYYLSLVAFIAFLLLNGISAKAQSIAFERDLPGEMRWSRVTPVGSLLVGGAKYLAHFRSDTGEELWVRSDLHNIASFNVKAVPGLPYLVISELVSKLPIKSKLQVIDLMTGETLWDTGDTSGSNLGGYPAPQRGSVFFVRDVAGKKGVKSGTYISEFDLASGDEKWSTRIGSMGKLPTHPIDDNGFMSGRDLSGHPEPMVLDNSFLLFAGDIYAFDLNDGTLKWRYKLKANHATLKRTFARPILQGTTLYAATSRRVVALDVTDGSVIWETKVAKGAIPQLELTEEFLVGRYGGTFSDGKKLAQMKPFGAFVLNRADGSKRWDWRKAKHSITNLAVFSEANRVALADKTTLYALKLDASKASIATKEKLAFKRKMGKADVAAKGIGALGGFLSGGLVGSARSMTGGDRSDPPLDISQFENQLVVRGQYHVLAYDMDEKATKWSVEFAPPGVSGLSLIAMGAVTAGLSYGSAVQNVAGNTNAYSKQAQNINNAFQGMVSERSAASEANAGVAFFLTQKEGDRFLVGLDLKSGDRIGEIPMKEKQPQFQVDAIVRRVFYFADDSRLVAFDF